MEFIVGDEEALRALFPPTHELAAKKSLAALDVHAREFIARSPFLCIGTRDQDGHADVSPRGDPAGFVAVLDDRTIAIPDRPGNNRLDTLSNIIADPAVGLLFIVPGFDDTLRINGKAFISRQPDVLEKMSVKGRAPALAIIVEVEEVFMHCAKAFRRSNLWNPDHFQDRSQMPSLIKIILDQTTGAPGDAAEQAKLDAALEEDYKNSMY